MQSGVLSPEFAEFDVPMGGGRDLGGVLIGSTTPAACRPHVLFCHDSRLTTHEPIHWSTIASSVASRSRTHGSHALHVLKRKNGSGFEIK